MNAAGGRTGDAERARFAALLDEAAAQSRTISFWWRDDDAVDVTPALERLLALARRFDLPLALAVIPQGANEALATRLADEPLVRVLQHGWSHANHAGPDEKKMELGAHRPLSAVTGELRGGLDRLSALFPETFLPVLVPPWNRIAETVSDALGEIGLAGPSTFGPAGPVPARNGQVNTHLDLAHGLKRGPLPRAEAFAKLAAEAERRLGGDAEPIGLLTHHLVHTDATWAVLEELLAMTANHPAVSWSAIAGLFTAAGAAPRARA